MQQSKKYEWRSETTEISIQQRPWPVWQILFSHFSMFFLISGSVQCSIMGNMHEITCTENANDDRFNIFCLVRKAFQRWHSNYGCRKNSNQNKKWIDNKMWTELTKKRRKLHWTNQHQQTIWKRGTMKREMR